MLNLKQRYGPWAVVAGASTGLGAAFADEVASRGVNVVLLARRTELLEETAARLRERHGVSVRPVTVDLADPDLWEVVWGATQDLEIGMLVYNAMYDPQGRFLDVPLRQHLQAIAVNCTAPTILSHELGRRMADRGRGSIVLVSSMAALQGIKIFASYGAGKAYGLILAEGLWDELREKGVDVLGYVVGATETPHYIEVQATRSGPPPTQEQIEEVRQAGSEAVAAPRSPEQVAAALFPFLEEGPRQYSHPDDEAQADADARRSRREVVEAMGKMTSLVWG
ncbi:MAG: SDR family NAD(P)-dependent oxidoreductase [Deltaproteobacteria bacterium]|jgi:short-subunit dehydrogenase|nr:SDR family NAD(P)-dependent oxidoreductase [Deltaproteobacteria bacterium]